MLIRLSLVASLLVPATSFADESDDEATTSYRRYTLAVDGVGLGLLVAGAFAEGDNGRDTELSDSLFGAGAVVSFFGTPIVHFSRGRVDRGFGSLFLRGGLASVGGLLAMSANSDCDDGMPAPEGQLFDDDFLCQLDYLGYGVIGGLIVASAIDAAFMTDEPIERPMWSPQVTASRDGVRAGVAIAW